MASVDWIKVKNEYINSDISQRKLAEKYNISYNTLKDKAHREKWATAKKRQHIRIASKSQEKTVEKIAEAESNRIVGLLKLTDKSAEKIATALDQLDKYVDMFGNVHESEVIDVGRLKKLVSAMRDVKEILGVDQSSGMNDEERKQAGLLEAIEKAVKNGNN